MAFYPKQSGTTVQTFEIGAGYGKNGFTIDTTSITTPITWTIPDNSTSGYVLSNDGTGVLSWVAAGTTDQTTPYYIASSDTFTVNLYKQNLFATDIDVEGVLVIDGQLIEVS